MNNEPPCGFWGDVLQPGLPYGLHLNGRLPPIEECESAPATAELLGDVSPASTLPSTSLDVLEAIPASAARDTLEVNPPSASQNALEVTPPSTSQNGLEATQPCAPKDLLDALEATPPSAPRDGLEATPPPAPQDAAKLKQIFRAAVRGSPRGDVVAGKPLLGKVFTAAPASSKLTHVRKQPQRALSPFTQRPARSPRPDQKLSAAAHVQVV